MPAARRFRELGVVGKDEIRDAEPVDLLPREVPIAASDKSVTDHGVAESSRGK
jgi:hypothetical protein